MNDLKKGIEELFGFKKELIESAELCGLWHARFTVNGIKYYGCVPYHGAVPQLFIDGYTTPYRWHGTPVTEEYYNKFIKGKHIRLQYVHSELGDGSWEWLDEYFSTPEEAETYITKLDEPAFYSYDIYEID